MIVGKELQTRWGIAHMVPKKGNDAYTVLRLAQVIPNVIGVSNGVIKSDQELAILKAIDLVKYSCD